MKISYHYYDADGNMRLARRGRYHVRDPYDRGRLAVVTADHMAQLGAAVLDGRGHRGVARPAAVGSGHARRHRRSVAGCRLPDPRRGVATHRGGCEMVSLLPIDLGFDPRVHRNMLVAIDVEAARRDGVRYLDAEGIERTLAPGTDAGEIGRRLTASGYQLMWDWPLPEGWIGRVVTLRSGEPVLELLDPNDGLPGGPKTRYQYIAAASGLVFRRRLPPAEHGEVWAGETEPPAWEDVDLSALTRPHAVLAFADAVSGRIKGSGTTRRLAAH